MATGRASSFPRTAGIPPSRRSSNAPSTLRKRRHGWVWVWYGQPRAEYPPVPWFPGLDGFAHATFWKAWDVDLTRAVEGLLDVSHLPFVHARTIGREQKTLVNGPYTTLEDDTIRVWVTNQPDDGLPAVKPSQLPQPEREHLLEFRFPNIWQIRLSNKFRIVNAIAPVADGQCTVYVRTYVDLGLPIAVGRLIASVNNVFNRYVLAEDYAVQRSQLPKVSDLDIGERFIPADRPIAMYLQRRRDLIEAAQVAGIQAGSES